MCGIVGYIGQNEALPILVGGLVLGEEFFASGLVGFGSEAILSVLFSLTSLRKIGQGLENDGVVHQEMSGIIVVTFLESLDKEIEVEVDRVAGYQLEASLVTEMGTESVAVLILIGHQSSLGLGTLAKLITASQSKCESTRSNNEFFVHFILFYV